MRYSLLRCLSALALVALSHSAAAADGAAITRIGFGSCIKQNWEQPIWKAVAAANPQIFVLLGDNIYADTTDPAVMAENYVKLATNPGFAALRAAIPVFATWDDHDYGANDAGADYPMKNESRELFLKFWGQADPDHVYGDEGVYSSWTGGSEGKRLQIILLDGRFFRTGVRRERIDGYLTYLPASDPGSSMLGERQWQWLEEQLRQPADLRIIGSGIQVVAEEHRWEKWANMPQERQRLFELIGKTQAHGVVFITGDRHLGEISKIEGTAASYPLYDITSSSLNASFGGIKGEKNSHRIAGENYSQVNFGLIEIDWDAASPQIDLQLRGDTGEIVREVTVPLSELAPSR